MKIFNLLFSSLLTFCLLFLISILPVFAQEVTEIPPVVEGDLTEIIARIIKLILGLVGVLALLMFIYGGVTWMTSAGNMEKVKKGKETLVWAVLGLAIVFLAYSLVFFIIEKILLEKGGG